MDIGTGIAILGVWLLPSLFAYKDNTDYFDILYLVFIAFVMTLLIAYIGIQ